MPSQKKKSHSGELPQPHPGYIAERTERVRINGRDCWEICGSKWPELVRDMAFWANYRIGKQK